MIGKKIIHNGETYYSPDILVDGYIYKDEDAFKNRPNEVCYIPEYSFNDVEPININGEDFYLADALDTFTRNDLEKLLQGETDEYGDAIDIESFFSSLEWAYPETYLLELV